MASPTYPLRALVLRRTKLGESDVICTLLSSDGSQVRAVAKGARKPTSAFASRLEVYAVCDLLLARGKTLDIIKEARLVEGNAHLRCALAMMEAAAPMVELLDRTTQAGLADARLFDMTCKALDTLKETDEAQTRVVCAAHLFKALAILGFRPRLDACVECGRPLSLENAPERVPFSLIDGGVVCADCRGHVETILLDRSVAQWAQALIFATFEEILPFEVAPETSLGLLRFLQLWVRQHVGTNLKSLSFLISQS